LAPIEGSFFRELGDAANSFNAMLGGLRWFERYVPQALVQRLIRLNDDSAVASTYRLVTTMFTDICGFTQVTEHMTAPESVELLNRHFTLLAACIEREGGTIDRFEGDGLLAICGALEPYDDMACRAANAIRRTMIEENRRQSQEGGTKLRIRISMHNGRFVVGNLGSPGRVSYTVAGDTVVITRRIEELARAVGSTQETVNILAGGSVRSALVKTLPMAHLGPHSLRGRSELVEIYALDPARDQ
jgi:class 3 adenylate cyclase